MQRQRFLALALAAAGLLAITSPAPAQEGRRMFDPVSRLLAQRSELAITDEQARRLEAIRTRYLEKNRPMIEQLRRRHAARDSAWKADSNSRESRRALRASTDSTRAEIMAVLTPAQKTKLDELRKKRREERRGDGHGRRHGGRHHGGERTDSAAGR